MIFSFEFNLSKLQAELMTEALLGMINSGKRLAVSTDDEGDLHTYLNGRDLSENEVSQLILAFQQANSVLGEIEQIEEEENKAEAEKNVSGVIDDIYEMLHSSENPPPFLNKPFPFFFFKGGLTGGMNGRLGPIGAVGPSLASAGAIHPNGAIPCLFSPVTCHLSFSFFLLLPPCFRSSLTHTNFSHHYKY